VRKRQAKALPVFWLRIERLNRNTRTVLYFAIPYLKQRGGRRRFMEGPALLAGSGRSDRYSSRRNPANFQRDVTIQRRGAGENPAASPENSAATVFHPVTSQPSSSLTRLSCRRPTSKTIRRRVAICSTSAIPISKASTSGVVCRFFLPRLKPQQRLLKSSVLPGSP